MPPPLLLLSAVNADSSACAALNTSSPAQSVTPKNVALLLRKASGKPVLASTRNTIQAFFRERRLGPRDTLDFRGFCDLYEKIGKPLASRPLFAHTHLALSQHTTSLHYVLCTGFGPPARMQSRVSHSPRGGENDSDFERGEKIEARYGGKSKWFPGKIARANANGS